MSDKPKFDLGLVETDDLLHALSRRMVSMLIVMERETNKDCQCGGHKERQVRVWYPHDKTTTIEAMGLAAHASCFLQTPPFWTDS